MFSLVADDFRVKYTAKNDALHLNDTQKKKNLVIAIDWSGRILLGIHLDWNYIKRTINLYMPTYIKNPCQDLNIKT